MDKKYCIFDMDGTLVDSMPYWNRLSPDYLISRGITDDIGDLMERIKTKTMPEACALLKKEFDLPEAVEEIAGHLGSVMREHYEKDIPAKTGVTEYLRALRDEGSTLCIVTATAPPLVRLCLDRLGLADLFEFILSCEEVGHGKDRPDAFFEAARRLGARPEETAVFEDAFVALRTAKEAGFYTVAVHDRFSENWEESAGIADEVIARWEETVR